MAILDPESEHKPDATQQWRAPGPDESSPGPGQPETKPAARSSRTVMGFAVGRTIFGEAARAWLGGTMSDEEAVAEMAGRFGTLVDIWERLGKTEAA